MSNEIGPNHNKLSSSSFVHFLLGSQINELNSNTLLAKLLGPRLSSECMCATTKMSPVAHIIEILSSHKGRVNYVHIGHNFQLKQAATYSQKIHKIKGRNYSPFNCDVLCKLHRVLNSKPCHAIFVSQPVDKGAEYHENADLELNFYLHCTIPPTTTSCAPS